MKRRIRLPAQWVLPVLTIALVLLAIVLPERISAWRDRRLFAAAHVEAFDSRQGVAVPGMTLEKRLRAYTALNFGETTDTYVRYEDTFSQEEIEAMDQLFRACIQKMADNSGIPLLQELNAVGLEYYDLQRAYIWDSATMENAVFDQMGCYNDKLGAAISLIVDEESGLPLLMSVSAPDLGTLFDAGKGPTLVELATSFTEPLGFTVLDSLYDTDNDAYLILQGEEGNVYYHISQKYDVLTVEPIPEETVGYIEYDGEVSVSIAINESIYDAS